MVNTDLSMFAKANIEVLKDFIRWGISMFLAWFIPNGYAFIMAFFGDTNIQVSAETIFLLGLFFKYLDFWYHRYRKQKIDAPGKSLGIYGL